MKAKEIVGKTVAGVRQEYLSNGEGTRGWAVQSITFTDGTVLILQPVDAGYSVWVEADVVRPGQGGPHA